MARPRRHDWPGYDPGQAFQGKLEGLPAAIYCRVSSNPDKSETKSTDDQLAEGLAWARQAGVRLDPRADVYTDDDFSASRYAVRDREAFIGLRRAVNAGKYKVVWFWATSRQTRGDIPLSELAAEYEDHGALWCFSGSLYNPANDDDIMILEIHHVIDKKYSAQLARDVRRGKKASAYAGKPHGRIPYGYRRVYDPDVRDHRGRPKWLCDEPRVFDGNAQPIEDSPAYIVREIFDRIAAGESISRIAISLEDRQIETPQKPRREGRSPWQWTPHTIKLIARNPAYISRRVFQAKSWRWADRHAAILPDVNAKWPPLVTEEQWWAVQRILSDPSRQSFRPGRGGSLLAGVVRCGECGSRMALHNDHRTGIVPYYVCSHRSHVGIRVDWLDAYVEDRIVSWLADEQVHAYLWGQREDDSAVAGAARAEVERLQVQIEECRVNGEDPDADAVFWERRSRALAAKLAEAEDLAQPASLSPIVAEMVGPDAADKWWKLRQENLPAAKQLIKVVADIRVHRGVRGGDRYHARIDPGRISWAWLTGPGDHGRVFGEPILRPMHRIAEALRADPYEADRAIATRLQCRPANAHRVRRQLEEAGEIPVIRRRGRGKPVVVSAAR
jgi:site-specific DNA recombinase